MNKRIDIVIAFFFLINFSNIQAQKLGSGVRDLDGNYYRTVLVGNMEWMRSNLATTRYANGDPIRLEVDSIDWVYSKDPIYTSLYNRPENSKSYGNLYNWYAINDQRNICPSGWHVATDFDWDALEYLLNSGRNTGGKLKSSEWKDDPKDVVRDSQFEALPGGYIMMGMHGLDGIVGFWWTSSPFIKGVSYARYIQYDDNELFRATYDNNSGLSVRCVRD